MIFILYISQIFFSLLTGEYIDYLEDRLMTKYYNLQEDLKDTLLGLHLYNL